MKAFLKLAIAAALIAATGACGGGARPEPEIRTVEVKVPVPVPCKATVDVRETYADEAAASLTDIYEQVRALLTGRAERAADAERLKGAVVGCGGVVK